MKLLKRDDLFKNGDFSNSEEWHIINEEIKNAILSVKWPEGSDLFTIYPESGKKRGQGNGVGPIKDSCMKTLKDYGWELESRLDIATVKNPGPIDATRQIQDILFALEWETGNISSSHRAINKMLLGMLKGILIGGALILPSQNLRPYLTDRVGNYPEIIPYFDLWKAFENANNINGILCVYVVEQDDTSFDVPRIIKATDGRALQ